MPEVANQIERFIRETFLVADDDPAFNRHVDLFEAGYVDSVGMVEMLGFIIDTFRIEVPDSALLSDEFTTIDGMARTIAGLAGPRASVREAAIA